MPVIKSLFNPLDNKRNDINKNNTNIEKLVMDIASEIITKSPDFAINAFGSKNFDYLKKEVIRILDRDSLYFSINRDNLIKGIFDFMFGYGALQEYIEDEDISDVDGTKYDEFTITRNGLRKRIDIDFGNSRDFETYCRLVAIRTGGFLNEDDTHCRTADIKNKLRINVSIPPRNVSGPAISIRKHRQKAYTLSDLLKLGMLDNIAYDFFQRKCKFFCAEVLIIFFN